MTCSNTLDPRIFPSLVAAVKAHALAHYEQDGWDYVIETMDDAEISKIIGKARTVKGAIAKVRAAVKPSADYRAEIQAEAF